MKIIDIHQDLFMTYGQQPEAFFDAQNGLSPDYNV